MVILSLGSIGSGFLLYSGKRLEYWLKPVVDKGGHQHEEFISHATVTTMALTAVLIGVAIAISKYRKDIPINAPEKVSIFTRAARKDLMQDQINEALFMKPGLAITSTLVKTDEKVIDGLVRGVAKVSLGSAKGLRRIQSGYIRNYALLILIGAAALIAAIWVVTL
jgi:NADH-quinone oxidoreductase subunit L